MEPLGAAVLADAAWRRLSHAIARGALRDALGWERLHRRLSRMAEADQRTAERARSEEVEAVSRRAGALSAALARAAAPDAGEAELATLEALLETHVPHVPHSDPASPFDGGEAGLGKERATPGAPPAATVSSPLPPVHDRPPVGTGSDPFLGEECGSPAHDPHDPHDPHCAFAPAHDPRDAHCGFAPPPGGQGGTPTR